MEIQLTYALTSLAPSDINEKFLQAKRHFNLIYNQPKTHEDNYILKNIAHITMVVMFYLNENVTEEIILDKLQNIQFAPIQITANEIVKFVSPKFGNILAIKVDKNNEILKLHSDLYDVIGEFVTFTNNSFMKENYTPHLSVLYEVPDEKVEEAKEYIRQNIVPIKYTLNSFLFMRDVPNVKRERSLIREFFAKK